MGSSAKRHHRRSIRLKGYDYWQAGAYFVTVCTQDGVSLFGEIVGGEMQVNEAGRMVYREWNALRGRFPDADLDAFVAMPNRVHGIIGIADAPTVGAGPDRATTRVAPTVYLPCRKWAMVRRRPSSSDTVGSQPSSRRALSALR